MHSAGGGKVNVGGVADDERHTPSVCRDEFGSKVRHGVNLGFLGKVADKGRKGQYYDVVGGKHGKQRDGCVQRKEQPPLSAVRVSQSVACQKAEKSQLVQKDGKHRHGKKQHENFDGIDGGVCHHCADDFRDVHLSAQQNDDGAYQHHYPIGAKA